VVPESATETAATLPGGVTMPLVAFGTWQTLGVTAYDAVLDALAAGYRHVDTAQIYGNEAEVGRAVRDSGIARAELFLATKLSQPEDFRNARSTVLHQLSLLGVDYVDMYMLHNVGPDKPSCEAAWRDLEVLHKDGQIRALGVSNFSVEALEELLLFAKVPPVYIQNKMSVYAPGEQRVSPDSNLIAFCRARDIQVMGYSVNNSWPLSLVPLEDPHVLAIASRYGKTPAQILLRWGLQLGAGVIAKSSSPARIRENLDIFDFCLGDADFAWLTALATLAESTYMRYSPRWVDDVFDVKGLPDLAALLT